VKPTYPTTLALAHAISSLEINDFMVHRDPFKTEDKQVIPNKTLIAKALESEHVASEQQLKSAEEIVVYLQQVEIMQNLIKGRADPILVTVNKLLTGATVKSTELGLVAWAPKLVRDYLHKDRIREISSTYESRSRFVGQINNKVTVEFTKIEHRLNKNTNSWVVYGHDENGNLIIYWANRQEKIVNKGQIIGTVKDQVVDAYRNNARVTILNRVKVI
jgi:hypothetical protein